MTANDIYNDYLRESPLLAVGQDGRSMQLHAGQAHADYIPATAVPMA